MTEKSAQEQGRRELNIDRGLFYFVLGLFLVVGIVIGVAATYLVMRQSPEIRPISEVEGTYTGTFSATEPWRLVD